MKLSEETNLRLYEIVVGQIIANEQKRQNASQIYVGFLAGLGAIAASVDSIDFRWLMAVCFLISLIWFFTIRYHRNLAKAKFHVIETLESTLPYSPYAAEHEFTKKIRNWPELTQIEFAFPLVGILASTSYFLVRYWC